MRSTLRVDDDLIGGGRLRFVGTATVGEDHVDRAALERRGIAFASAAGSSAQAVRELTLALLIQGSARAGLEIAGKTLAVIGCGAIGARVARSAERLGLVVQRHDPPLAAAGAEAPGGGRFAKPDALAAADFVSLHVPLTDDGPWPTRGMVDQRFLAALKPGAFLINTARGRVIDAAALIAARGTGRLAGCALDVFPTEPDLDPALVRASTLATPHVAGRSLDGLAANTAAIADAFARVFGLDARFRVEEHLPDAPRLPLLPAGDLARMLERIFGLEALDGELRVRGEDVGPAFTSLRNRRPLRRDLAAHRRRGDEPRAFVALLDALRD